MADPVNHERKSVSIMKAAELTGVARRTIYNWMAAGRVEHTRTAGGSVRIFTDTLFRADRPASLRGGSTQTAAPAQVPGAETPVGAAIGQALK